MWGALMVLLANLVMLFGASTATLRLQQRSRRRRALAATPDGQRS
jgi:hypothetical protein